MYIIYGFFISKLMLASVFTTTRLLLYKLITNYVPVFKETLFSLSISSITL